MSEIEGTSADTGADTDTGAGADSNSDAGAVASNLPALLARFGLRAFRPHQAEVCAAVISGQDALLVMPTGAGKSLCYQLPGVARGGTTLVISPLIALIDDQVSRLRQRGFRAEGLHGGMTRDQLRAVSASYLKGELDFLFVAPERFAVPRFPEMLLRRKPSLIAIDEAHCISQWGHDFRPDYRLLGERIQDFRPAPVIALTATATADVQKDIIAQLRLVNERRSIHGFWRSNLALEVAEAGPDDRVEIARDILADPARRPAIVYAPTRKQAEELAAELKQDYRAAFYHAGMDSGDRERVQAEFLAGRTEVIVATVAFGMGIDKPDVRTVIHVALPGNVEGYYQEIGRAGRDGKLSRAILLFSRADEETQRYFHRLNYPEVAVLEKIVARVPDSGSDTITPDLLAKALRMDPGELKAALAKLITHGAVLSHASGVLLRGTAGWQKAYSAIREHKLVQLQGMVRFAEGKGCRMAALVRYFGDRDEARGRCGHCDACAPGAGAFEKKPDERHEKAVARALTALFLVDDAGSSSLYKTAIPDGLMDRRAFDHVLGVMEREGWITLNPETFEKEGRKISFTKVRLTHRGKEQAKRVEADIELWAE